MKVSVSKTPPSDVTLSVQGGLREKLGQEHNGERKGLHRSGTGGRQYRAAAWNELQDSMPDRDPESRGLEGELRPRTNWNRS